MLKKIDASNKNMKETTLKLFGSFVKELKEFKYINLLIIFLNSINIIYLVFLIDKQ